MNTSMERLLHTSPQVGVFSPNSRSTVNICRAQTRIWGNSSRFAKISDSVAIQKIPQESLKITRSSSSPPTLLAQFNGLSIVDQLFVVLGVLSCMTVGALLTALVAAIPTLKAIKRASASLEKLSDMAREELPGTMAAIRLSSMEISDLTFELNDLSQEITDGVRSSARAVQAAEVGIRRMGALAASQTFAMLQERATVPVEAVATAAASTRQAVLQAQRAMLTLASHPQVSRWLLRKKQEAENIMDN